MSAKYYLGCPVWACEAWKGKLFPPKAKRSEWLGAYSKQFNSVEGNTTFYAIPTPETALKWVRSTADSFRFALKFPKVISHDCRLVGCQRELDMFRESLEVLNDAGRLGPTFLQLPPDFGGAEFPGLAKFLEGLPRELDFAVEVRHEDYFISPFESEFVALLKEQRMDRVVFDSRALFHFPPADLTESAARKRKPQIPIRKEATGRFPILRLIGVNRIEKVAPWIEEWSLQVATWMKEGRIPFVFTHAPNDEFAPEFAGEFHRHLQRHVPELADLPEISFPGEQQLDLF